MVSFLVIGLVNAEGEWVNRVGLILQVTEMILSPDVTELWWQAWSCGGYSDDLIMAAKCGEHRLPILCPPFTIFPQRCASYSLPQNTH